MSQPPRILSEELSQVFLVELPRERVVDALVDIESQYGPTSRTGEMVPRDALLWFLPLRTYGCRTLVRSFGRWTGVVCNGGNGSFNTYVPSKQLGVPVVEILWQRDIRRVAITDASRPDSTVFHAHALRDAGWQHYEKGTAPAEFGRSAATGKKSSERLTREHVLSFLEALSPACGRNPWSLDGAPMVGVEHRLAAPAASLHEDRPHLDDIGLDGPAVSIAAANEGAGLTLAPYVTPETFLAHLGDGSFPGGGRAELERVLAAIGTCSGVTHVRFGLTAWEDIEDAPHAEAIWVLGTTKKEMVTALKGLAAAPDDITSVASKERPPELWPGRWLRLWWD